MRLVQVKASIEVELEILLEAIVSSLCQLQLK